MEGNPPRTDILYTMYAEELEAIAEDNRQYAGMLAEDWTQYQPTTGLLVPRYLEGLALEVEERLLKNNREIHYVSGTWVSLVEGDTKGQLNFVRDLHYSERFNQAKKLFQSCRHLYQGLPAVIFNEKVLSEAEHRSQRGIEAAKSIIEINATEESVALSLFTAFDYCVYKSAKHSRSLDGAKRLTVYASSPEAQRAMRAALDLKVFKFAVKQPGDGYAEAADVISEYASSSEARETMLGHLAMRASGNKRRSAYLGNYRPRITRDLGRERQDQHKEERRQHWERERQQSAPKFDAGWANRPVRRVDTIIARSNWKVQSSLRACGESEIERVITVVEQLRAGKPDISAREVYLHFHSRAQSLEPSTEDVDTTKVLGLLLNGDFSKDAVLPF